MGEKSAKPDLVVAGIAARQHGVVSIGQLREAGLGKNAVAGRVRVGRLHRVHRGVYAVGHTGLSAQGRWMAAVLACGVSGSAGVVGAGREEILTRWGAALSHRSAATHWGMLPPADGLVHVSVPGAGGKRWRQGIRIHRCVSLTPAAVTLHRGIPITTPARTIEDLRRLGSARELRGAIRQADVLGLPIGGGVTRDRTRSDLERDFLRLCRRHRLPAPEVNVRVDRHLVDFLWRDCRLVVETDGYRYHRGREAFHSDRARDLGLRRLGYAVIHLSDRQLEEEAGCVVEVLRDALGHGGAPHPDL